MADYKGIKGFKVKSLTSDPTASASTEGQVWYNTTSNTLKVVLAGGAPIGTWASGGDLTTARSVLGGAGYASAGLAFGGKAPPTYPKAALTESYDGTSWSEVADLDVARDYVQGAGLQGAALAIAGSASAPEGGTDTGKTESWNGASWTEVADLSRGAVAPASGTYGMGCGIQTSALYFGGGEGDGNTLALNESWDGTSWSEQGDMNVAKAYGAGIGTSNTSALSAGGLDWIPGSTVNTASTEEWNGTAWTEVADLNQGRGFTCGSTLGSTTNAIVFGGRDFTAPTVAVSLTEFYNGSTWTEVADLATGAYGMGCSGTPGGSGAFSAGGATPSIVAGTEEFVAADYQIKTVTIS